MNRLVGDLLDAAALESKPLPLVREVVNAAELLGAVHAANGRLVAGASLRLHLDVRPQLPDIRVDVDKIHRVFGNLIENALKFTPGGGMVTLGAAPGPTDGWVLFWVADSGRGLDAGRLTEMFTRRWQADPERHGQGLGLAIARSIVEAHGGQMWAESQVGKGTTIFFSVPSAG
jgi:signal transduction histidine kinase